METANQDRKKHHSSEDHSDEDYYSYDDNYGKSNQMCCPYMNYCPCMNQKMNYKSMEMHRAQDEQTENDSVSVNSDDFRNRRPYYPGYGYSGYGFGYPGYGYGWGHHDWYNHGWNGHDHNDWNGHHGWDNHNDWHRNGESQV